MTGVLFPRDIRTKLITRIKDNSYGVNAFIATINTERTETTPTLTQVDGKTEGNFPALFIDLGNSVYNSSRGSKATTLSEVITCEVVIWAKGNVDGDLYNDCENYLEALIRCLNGYEYDDYDGNFFIIATDSMREDIDLQAGQTTRQIGILFEIHRNEL